jgi:N-methylhydantoinase A
LAVRYRLGVDIGGTFTDATLIDEESGEQHTAKVLSTSDDPSIGFMEAVLRALRQAGAGNDEVRYVVHATTVATNAIIEGKIARTGFVTTEGFRDMLEIARQIRPSLYDTLFEKPPPLVPRFLCFEVPERLDARGNVLVPLDEDAMRRVAERLAAEGVESVAVCLLHGYVNPAHERRIGEILGERFPADAVSLSSDVAPEFREYLRASTTVINAGIRPIVHRYLAGIGERLRESGITADLLVMQSNGGVFSATAAGERPVFMVESGPAAGVIAATHLGERLGHRDLISFDMGGTTAKVGLVEDGSPRVTKEYQVGATSQAGIGSLAASGYPVRTPVIDLVEIGAGGGSIAWIDPGGLLRVGPQSAGADPGPVCYGRGGSEPTVTDANLVLGRLNPDFFLGGEIKLDIEAARASIKKRCADPLGMDVVVAANGIVEIANAAMVNALHLVSVQRGYDPRQFVLVAFGGGGPVHANALQAEAGILLTVIPPSPGVFSSLGLLVTELKREYTVTLLRHVDVTPRASGAGDTPLRPDEVEEALQLMERQGEADLAREGTIRDEMSFVRQAGLRYVGQSHELSVSLPDVVTERALADLVAAFHTIHERANGFSAPGEPVELVNLRVTAVGRLGGKSQVGVGAPSARPDPKSQGSVGAEFISQQPYQSQDAGLQAQDASPKSHVAAVRPVYFGGKFLDCPIYKRSQLAAGAVINGPAIIEEWDSTTVVNPSYQASVDELGNLLLRHHEKRA